MLRTTHLYIYIYSADSYIHWIGHSFNHWIGLIHCHWITYPPFVQPAHAVLYTLFILRRMKINETLLWQIKTVLGASKAIKRKKIPQK